MVPSASPRPSTPRGPACVGRVVAWVVLGLASGAASAQSVHCHVAYAGATRVFQIAPTPHDQAATPLIEGATLRVEVLNRLPPSPGAGVTVRTHGIAQGQPYLLHQGSYLPGAPAVGPHGFTGLQVVREPTRGNELAYWCERRP